MTMDSAQPRKFFFDRFHMMQFHVTLEFRYLLNFRAQTIDLIRWDMTLYSVGYLARLISLIAV